MFSFYCIFKGDNLDTKFGCVFQPVESDLLSKSLICESHALWTQNNLGNRHLSPEQVIIIIVASQ